MVERGGMVEVVRNNLTTQNETIDLRSEPPTALQSTTTSSHPPQVREYFVIAKLIWIQRVIKRSANE